MPDIIQVGGSGLRGEYHWMTNGHFELGDLLERCPQVVVSQVPLDLGQLSDESIFENEMAPGRVFALVNFPHFQLHEGEGNPLVKLFWEQIAWIQPESFIYDGGDFLTFVSREKDIFESVVQTLRQPTSDS
jgi:hypothetical protein